MSQDLVSFVLRFVREVGEDQQARWRGMIKHVQGNTESNFTQFSEALTFMQGHVNEVIRQSFAEGEQLGDMNPFLETTRLWGEFMPRYTKMMMDSMGEAVNSGMAAGTEMPEQMQQMMATALKTWGMPTQQEQAQAADRLATLTQQLDELTNKIDTLEKRLQKK